MNCYCANYYGSIGCRNTVSKFGERCKLCVALKTGSSMTNGLLDDDDLWMVGGSEQKSRSCDGSREGSHGGHGGGKRGWGLGGNGDLERGRARVRRL